MSPAGHTATADQGLSVHVKLTDWSLSSVQPGTTQRLMTPSLCFLALCAERRSHTHARTHAVFTFHAGGPGSGGAGHLAGETGTLDGLRTLLDLVLVAAAMDGHHLAGALLHLVRHCQRGRGREGEGRGYFQLIDSDRSLSASLSSSHLSPFAPRP